MSPPEGRCDRCPAYGCTQCPWALLVDAQKLLSLQEDALKRQEALLLQQDAKIANMTPRATYGCLCHETWFEHETDRWEADTPHLPDPFYPPRRS